MPKSPQVVVVGAGFGGLQVAQSLSNAGVDVLLIDRNNYNTFVPLLYQVAAAQIEPEKIAYPIRTVLRRSSNLQFLMAEVQHINFTNQVVKTNTAVIPYDFLVLATGSRTHSFGVPGASEHAFFLRNLNQSVELRNHILHCFEHAAREFDPVRRQQLLTFVVVGGGATGVEMAGTLVELKRSLIRDYPLLDLSQMRIILLQSGDRLLSDLPKRLGDYTQKKLRQIGVEVNLQTRVSRVTQDKVQIESGAAILTKTVIWAAGLEAARPELAEKPEAAARGKLPVRSTLQLEKYPNAYAIGDLAHVVQKGNPLTGLAPEALQQGVSVARNIKRQLKGQQPQPFSYFNKGRLAIIGCYSGVGKIGPILLTGFLPWLMWLGVHLVYLPSLRNRVLVLLTWLHGYLKGDRAVRLIMSQEHPASKSRSTDAAKVIQI